MVGEVGGLDVVIVCNGWEGHRVETSICVEGFQVG